MSNWRDWSCAMVSWQGTRLSSVTMAKSSFDLSCTRCSRLARHLQSVRKEYPDYHARPVAPFGVARPQLLIVGLAPGMHGANATGRPFTGDYAGILLYDTLYKFGFSSKNESLSSQDGLKLRQCRITNAVKCLPPENKPTPMEITTCNDYLAEELAAMGKHISVLVLGGVAHGAVLRALGYKKSAYPFAHGKQYALPNGMTLFTSYHCSRYNTQTRRLTTSMFHGVFRQIQQHLA